MSTLLCHLALGLLHICMTLIHIEFYEQLMGPGNQACCLTLSFTWSGQKNLSDRGSKQATSKVGYGVHDTSSRAHLQV